MTLIGGAILFALTGCEDKKAEIKTEPQKEAYAIGASFANYMKDSLDRDKITLDASYVISGFTEAYQDKSQYTKEEIQEVIQAFGKRMQEENTARIEKEKADSVAAGDAYRTEFAAQEGVKQTESGLLYQILEEGTGRNPTADDVVIVHYTGTLVDGRKFDSSYDRGQPAVFPLGNVIKAWTEGVQLIGVGGKIKLVAPPELAYGEQSLPAFGDNAAIPASSTLVFEVELLGIQGEDNSAE